MKYFIRLSVIFLSLLCLWQLTIFIFKLPSYILPTPLQVWHAGSSHIHLILYESLFTLAEVILGLLLAIFLGSIAALAMAYFKPLGWWLLPLLVASQALPVFAIAPLVIMWLGYGMASKIAVTLLMLFFPVTSAFHDGLRKTPNDWMDLAYVMQAKKWRSFAMISIPAALPSWVSGVRLATAAAPMGAIIGEWIGSNQGLGFLMLNANARMMIDLMFAAFFAILVLSLLLYYGMNVLLKKLLLSTRHELAS